MSTNYRRDMDALHDRIRMREKARLEQQYRRICAYCKRDMVPTGPGFAADTHGCCDPLCDAAKEMGLE